MMRAALVVLSLCLATMHAQTPLGTVTGLATDPSGSAIPGATITLISQETGVKRGTSTNDSGAYSFPNLPPGIYKLSAEARGFRALETVAFPLEAYRTVRQDLHFEVAGASTEVTVTAAASAAIQTETPAISYGLETRQILELPTNLRSIYSNAGDSGVIFIMMPLTIPGVVQVGNGAKWLTPGAGATGMKLKVDGIETNFGNFGSPDSVSQPSMEAIQEFTANVLTNRAEFGGLGTVTTVTKSGTNQYHADLFWYLRNSALDARNAFSTTRPYQNLHNYGAAAGGPLRKDKTFFYFDFDGTRGSRAYLFTSSVPTAAQRTGDFGAAAIKNPFTGAPFPNNRIPAQLLSPQAQRAQDLFYPQPNYGPPDSSSGNYRASFNGPEVHRIVEIRLDHNFSGRHLAFLRYQAKKDDYRIPGARSALPPSSVGTSTNIRRVNFWTLGDVYTIRPNVFNEFRAGVVILVSQSSADLTGQKLLDQIGIHGLPPKPYINGLVPNISVTGLSAVGQRLLNPVNDGHGQFADNITWIHGRHSMKLGAEMVSWFVNRYLADDAGLFGNFSFTNRFSGNPYADFLLGLPTSVTRTDPYATQYNRFRDWAFYAQDDFKMTPTLTLSYGLRYEYNGPAYALDDNIYSFDVANGAIVIPSDKARRLFSPYFPASLPVEVGSSRSLRHADRNNFAPRFGFSYRLGPQAVLRGGWGVYYSHLSANVPASLATGPFAINTTSTNAIVNGSALFTFENPFAAPSSAGTLNLTGVSPRLLDSDTQQYSLSYERELRRDMGLRVSYIGSKGSQLIYMRNLNQPRASDTPFTQARRPYPAFNSIGYADNGANMLYSGMQTAVEKRFSKRLMFSSTWTWAKELSDVDDTGGFELNTQIENTYDRRRDRANVYSVPRHQWMNQALYELPYGWQINALLNVSTGNFLNAAFAGADPSNTNTIGGRPDVVKTSINMPKTADAWFDRAAFGVPPNGRFGNAARNLIVGPGYSLFNLGVAKTMRLERAGSIQVVVSFQNLLNHVNLGEPQLAVNNANGGKITSTHIFPPAGSARTGQVGLRWSF